jgi:hypothetical protein
MRSENYITNKVSLQIIEKKFIWLASVLDYKTGLYVLRVQNAAKKVLTSKSFAVNTITSLGSDDFSCLLAV